MIDREGRERQPLDGTADKMHQIIPFDFAQGRLSPTQSRRSGGRSMGVWRSMFLKRWAMAVD